MPIDKNLGLSEYGAYTKSTRVLLSFGGAGGGFEFAMQLRKDVMDRFKIGWSDDPAFCYLDAESLKRHQGTAYRQVEIEKDGVKHQLDLYKMSNKKWAEFYEAAMDTCRTMIFIFTKEWMESPWCWGELDWYRERLAAGKKVKPVFVIFPNAREYLMRASHTVVNTWTNTSATYNPQQIWDGLRQVEHAAVVHINSEPIAALGSVTVEGQAVPFAYHYTCSWVEQQAILNHVVT